MSVKDINKSLIISDCITGEVIDVIPYDLYNEITIKEMLYDIYYEYVVRNEHGYMVKYGYKS